MLITPRSYGLFSQDILQSFPADEYKVIRDKGPFNEDELGERLQGVHGLIVGTDQVTRKALKHAGDLEIIVKYGVGVDNIDMDYAADKGIVVENTPGVNTEAVADYTFGLLLMLARQAHLSDMEIRNGDWKKRVGQEIYEKNIGILGLGAIGKAIAKRATGFDMNLFAYDLYKDEAFAEQYELTYLELDEVIEQSDILCIHLPLNKETKHLINEERLTKMKSSAYIINTARGGIIDEQALYEALKERVIAGAALDVFEAEPLKDSPLLELDNIILTPHNASASQEATNRMTIQSTNKLLTFYRDRSVSSGNLH
ncbi:phosphoglycerate dehydrogenase [Bacillus tianshenii]|nr:phosphoglycerate dehydrogenase [Bacillus tianshenii]